MKEALTYIVSSLVEKSDEVSLESNEDGNVIRFKINLAPSDRGRIIGKEGKVIKAIRNFLQSVAHKTGKKVFIDIL
ncbi:MAG: KH domain-containing protein [Elusimicrobiales bacterium]|nr:KH domain-containing protein [Elusimicrobiales bacterium]MCK5106589.1 KH domain-containing protein [Elusimicrobiales bacterium]MCK5357246.1 KH domain-containing protein [Elusimicrobiales bacterium]MCK5584258.1 KH domain-containing protein [Elusimicrobiales bacterium]